jgi:hypothetical protein
METALKFKFILAILVLDVFFLGAIFYTTIWQTRQRDKANSPSSSSPEKIRLSFVLFRGLLRPKLMLRLAGTAPAHSRSVQSVLEIR